MTGFRILLATAVMALPGLAMADDDGGRYRSDDQAIQRLFLHGLPGWGYPPHYRWSDDDDDRRHPVRWRVYDREGGDDQDDDGDD